MIETGRDPSHFEQRVGPDHDNALRNGYSGPKRSILKRRLTDIAMRATN